jgi:mRNA interferase MazF
MKRGDVVLVRFPHPSGQRGKKRPAVVVQSDTYAGGVLSTVVVAEVTKNLSMKDNPARLFIDLSTPDGQATGVRVDSIVSSLALETGYADTIAQLLGTLSTNLLHKFDGCLKVGLGLP